MTKRIYLGGAAALAMLIALPVTAGQHNGLRGAFNAPVPAAQAYVQAGTWQQARLQQQMQYNRGYAPAGMAVPSHGYTAAPQYVRVNPQGYAPEKLGVSSYESTRPKLAGLRGLSAPRSVRYDRKAASEFDRRYVVGGTTVRTNALHTRDMLDWQENTTGKTMTLLANRANGTLADNSLYIGAGFQGGLKYQKTSVDGQFPILSRFPFFSDRTDDSAGVFAIDHAALSFTSTFGDWTTVYLQPEYSETEYGRDQDEFQLRKAFVVFGDLEKTPFYAAFGRKTIDFGNFDSYNAFTHNEGAHYFWAVSDQPVLELGLYSNGFKLTGSAFSAGRQLRVALAGEENNLGNYAFNAEKEFRFGQDKHKAFTLGGGYLHDSIYRDNWTAHTFQGRNNGTPPANFIEYRNSLVNGFAEYNSPFFDAMVEYTTTLKPWGAAIPQTPDGTPLPQFLVDPAGSTTDINNINFDENLSVLVAQARIKPMVAGRRMAIAAVGSWGNISDDTGNVNAFGQPTSFESNQQHALSVEYPINDYLEFGAEYVYNKGFIPFVAPQVVSNDETEAHAVNVGFKARF
jgi:hypothetical protein